MGTINDKTAFMGIDPSDDNDYTIYMNTTTMQDGYGVTFSEPMGNWGSGLELSYDEELSYFINKRNGRYEIKLVQKKDLSYESSVYFHRHGANYINLGYVNRIPNNVEDLKLMLSYED